MQIGADCNRSACFATHICTHISLFRCFFVRFYAGVKNMQTVLRSDDRSALTARMTLNCGFSVFPNRVSVSLS